MSETRIIETRMAGDEHQVLSVAGGQGHYRRQPCGAAESTEERPGCPWRVDAVGHFPAEAFAHSARTAEDLSGHTFGCHESGADRPAVCAGFLLRGADHNMAIRMRLSAGQIDLSQVDDGGYELHPGYITMATENGLDMDDPALRNARWSQNGAGVPMRPSEQLVAAADLIRDLAAKTTKPRPNGHGWSVPGEEDGWEPDWSAVVSCAGYGGEDVVACDVRVGDARWIAALSPTLAPHVERWLRESAESLARHEPAWRDQPDVFDEPIVRRSAAEVDALVEHHYGAALGVANAIVGSGVDTP